MRKPCHKRKFSKAHLAPLRRWLRSNAGRPWNEVYSEASAIPDPANSMRSHLLDFVYRNNFMHDGEVWCHVWPEPAPVSSLVGHTIWPKFYVHPETGILREVPHRKHREPFVPRKTLLSKFRRWISDWELLMKIEGFWYLLEMSPIDQAPKRPPFDLLFKLRLSASHAVVVYSHPLYATSKRQLSHAELKKYHLQNSASPSGIHEYLGKDRLGCMRGSNA